MHSEVTLLIGVVGLLALLALALRLFSGKGRPDELQSLRNDLNLLRESSEKSAQGMVSIFSAQLQGINSTVHSSLASVGTEVGNRLEAINRNVADRLNENATVMRSSSKEVNDRITSVQGTFAGLQKQVGEMTEQARQLGDVARSLGTLERVLSAPKLRGGFGEAQLENLLVTVFAREQFELQYRFASGEVADAVLLFPQGMVAIDSKFSLENFRRISAAESEGARNSARKEFLSDVRRRIDEVAAKYIRPAEGTLPFALMYIPAENVYYEAIIRDEEGNDLGEYCAKRRVTPVSPNSLYAYLQTIVMGLNSMRLSQRAESMLREIASLQLELEKFEDVYGKLGTHLRNASRSYDDSSREFSKLETRVEGLAGANNQQALFPEQKKHAVGSGE